MMKRETEQLSMNSLYQPKAGPMRVAIMMSGSGTNAERIIEYARATLVPPYEPVILFTENPESKAESIGQKYDLPAIVNDRKEFFRESGKKGNEARILFDEFAADIFQKKGIDVVALAGYNWFVTETIFCRFLTVNVHPGDLRPLDGNGERKYAGGIGHVPIMNAIINGKNELRSTVHIVNEIPDGGDILMVSDPVPVLLPEDMDCEKLGINGNQKIFEEVAKTHQQRLKELGDWTIFPRTLELLAEGRYARSEDDSLYFDNAQIPYGIEYGKVI